MGSRGPVPKRTDQRRRRNRPEVPAGSAPAARSVRAPRPDPAWHPIVRDWYRSLRRSGQSAFYEPSDWQTARLIAESMSRDLKPQFVAMNEETGEPVVMVIPVKGASLAAYLKAMSALLVTEGDRRRSGVELQRPPEQPAGPGVPHIDDYRDRLSG